MESLHAWHEFYLLLGTAGATLAASIMIYLDWAYALEVLGGGLLVLAVVNIRNAWDLTLSMVRRHAGERSSR